MKRLLAFFGLVLMLAVLFGCASSAPPSAIDPNASFGKPVALPSPDTTGARPLESVLSHRRSMRSLGAAELSTATLGQLLWAGQGITDMLGHRNAPSAGALYPVELYAVTSTQLLHYLPTGHRVEARSQHDIRPQLQRAALDQPPVGSASVVFVIAAVPSRTTAKYGKLGDTFVALEVGHVAQNMLLEATALRLAAVPVGGIDSAAVAGVLALPPEQRVYYLLPVGTSG